MTSMVSGKRPPSQTHAALTAQDTVLNGLRMLVMLALPNSVSASSDK